jgi:hypothetical protein
LPGSVRRNAARLPALPIDYARLVQLLGIRSYGAAFSNLRRLEELGVSVIIEKGSIAKLRRALDQGSPIIVAVNTGPLTYWTDDTAHALVVVGFEQETILVNDPEFEKAPQAVPWMSSFWPGLSKISAKRCSNDPVTDDFYRRQKHDDNFYQQSSPYHRRRPPWRHRRSHRPAPGPGRRRCRHRRPVRAAAGRPARAGHRPVGRAAGHRR